MKEWPRSIYHVASRNLSGGGFLGDLLALALVATGFAGLGSAQTTLWGGLFAAAALIATGFLLLRLRARSPDAVASRTIANLSRRNDELTTALNQMSQGLCMFDADKRLVVCNEQYAKLYNIAPELIQPGISFRDIIQSRIDQGAFSVGDPESYIRERIAAVEERRPSVKVQHLPDGRSIAISHRPMDNGGWVATHDDITEIRRIEAQIAYMAHHDGLTDLPNRVRFREELDRALESARRGVQHWVLCLDLDHFKAVNDTLGHPVGDALLKAVAERLTESTRECDIVARLSGDEFAILQGGIKDTRTATQFAERLIKSLSLPYELDGHHVVISTSVGIAVAPTDSTDADQLLKLADMALYRAKTEGRCTYRFFEPEMDARMQARRTLELDLRKALSNNEFELQYQPLMNVETDKITGFEALLRWHQPDRGTIAPAEFIPLAEEIGLIGQIGAWVLKQACAEAVRWPEHIRLAVNLSPAQFNGRQLVLDVLSALGESGLSPNRLELEITETVMLHDSENTLATLHSLREIGVRISMDDFGTGYSSLSLLRRFPFDKIKIDQSFVQDLPDHPDSLAIVKAVFGLSKSLGIATTAEGVETADQLSKLRKEGFVEVQGYLFSPARSAGDIADMLAAPAKEANPAA